MSYSIPNCVFKGTNEPFALTLQFLGTGQDFRPPLAPIKGSTLITLNPTIGVPKRITDPSKEMSLLHIGPLTPSQNTAVSRVALRPNTAVVKLTMTGPAPSNDNKIAWETDLSAFYTAPEDYSGGGSISLFIPPFPLLNDAVDVSSADLNPRLGLALSLMKGPAGVSEEELQKERFAILVWTPNVAVILPATSPPKSSRSSIAFWTSRPEFWVSLDRVKDEPWTPETKVEHALNSAVALMALDFTATESDVGEKPRRRGFRSRSRSPPPNHSRSDLSSWRDGSPTRLGFRDKASIRRSTSSDQISKYEDFRDDREAPKSSKLHQDDDRRETSQPRRSSSSQRQERDSSSSSRRAESSADSDDARPRRSSSSRRDRDREHSDDRDRRSDDRDRRSDDRDRTDRRSDHDRDRRDHDRDRRDRDDSYRHRSNRSRQRDDDRHAEDPHHSSKREASEQGSRDSGKVSRRHHRDAPSDESPPRRRSSSSSSRLREYTDDPRPRRTSIDHSTPKHKFPCRFFGTRGGCFKGAKCEFLHADGKSMNVDNADIQKSPVLCRHFQRLGKCQLGESCRFKHA
eukprot:m.7326 g.7326  ORF g.7326 m.7326 type:complete len:572 (+) comp3948_c0_seq1:356-2071(+)